jgi:hypothetical protein
MGVYQMGICKTPAAGLAIQRRSNGGQM